MNSLPRRQVLRTTAGAVGAAATGAFATGCDSAPTAPAAGRATPGTAGPSGRATGPRPRVRPARLPGRPDQIEHGPRDAHAVALTFHGQGDPKLARALLAEAERAHARITVLAVGTWLDAHPDMAHRILDGGHEIGNHTMRHLSVNGMPSAQAYAEISQCAQRLRRLTGGIGTWFRPSRARLASDGVVRLARRAGYPHVLSYDVDSLDYQDPGPDAVRRTVLAQARPGSVVSLHFGHAGTVSALPALLDGLHQRGLRPVTTTELVS